MDAFNVLFICEHNTGRSQMAEAYLEKFGEDLFSVESAGLNPGTMNQYVIDVLMEEQIDISGNPIDSVIAFFREGRTYDFIITVCSKEAGTQCPLFPGRSKRLYWPFDDPAKVTGSREEKLEKVREIRNQIKSKVMEFIQDVKRKGLKIFIEDTEQ